MSAEDEDLVSLRAVLALMARKRWWILGSMVICTVILTFLANWMTPIYRASVIVVAVSSERSSLAGSIGQSLGQFGGGLASLAGLNLGSGNTETQEALGVLKSRQFGEQFIQDENLLPQMYPSRWDAHSGTWKTDQPAPTLNRGFNYFNKGIRAVNQDTKTGLITLQIDWRDREAAAKWANDLLKRLNTVMRRRAIDNAGASIAFLEKELQTTPVVETRDAINRLIEAQVKQRMLANVTEEYVFRLVDPAIAPDADDPAKPPKLLMEVSGPFIGLLLSVAVLLMLGPGDSAGGGRNRGRRAAV